MTTLIKVAIVEDNYHLRESLQLLIGGTPGFACTGAYPNADFLIARLQSNPPHVVLMDIDIPGKSDGIEAVKLVKAAMPEVHVLMQTVFDDEDKIFKSIMAGANGYILKNTPPVKILSSIEEISQGGAPMTPVVAAKALQFFRQGPPSNLPETLTPRQLEVLDLIVQGYSYKRISEKIFVSMDTVRFHVKKVYELLHVHSRAELIHKTKKYG